MAKMLWEEIMDVFSDGRMHGENEIHKAVSSLHQTWMVNVQIESLINAGKLVMVGEVRDRLYRRGQ